MAFVDIGSLGVWQESVAVLWAEVGRHGDPLRLRLAHEGTWDLADVMNRRTRCGDELRVGRSPVFVIVRSDPDAFKHAWTQARAATDRASNEKEGGNKVPALQRGFWPKTEFCRREARAGFWPFWVLAGKCLDLWT